MAALALAALALPAAAYSNGYIYSRAITVASAVVPSTQVNFPMLVSGTYAYLATFPNGGMIHNTVSLNSQVVPADLIFTSDAAGTTLLNWEVASYTASTGTIEAWVQIPSLSNGTVIYMFYSNLSVNTYQSNAASTWGGNYGAVWHMANGITQSLADSSGNGNRLTNSNTTATAGLIDGGSANSGNSAGLYGASSGVDSLPNLTYSLWVKPAALTNSTGSNLTLISAGEIFWVNPASGTISAQIAATTSYGTATSTNALVVGSWQYVVMTYSSPNAPLLYLNGNQVSYSSQHARTGADSYASGGAIGTPDYNPGSSAFNGVVDEARISSVARPADWIATEFNNQSSPSTFYTIGPVTSIAAVGGTAPMTIVM